MKFLYLFLSIFYFDSVSILNSNPHSNSYLHKPSDEISEINPEHLKNLKLKIVQANGQKQTVDLGNATNPYLTVRSSRNTAQFKSHNPQVQMAYELTFKDPLNLIHFLYLDDKGNVIIEGATLTSSWSIKTTGTLIFRGNNNFATLHTKSSAFINEGLFKAINGNHRHDSYTNYGVMHFTNQTAQALFNDYQKVYGDYLKSSHSQVSPLTNTLENYGVLLTDNGIKFLNINQINHGLSMLRNAHIEQGSIENHNNYVLQGDFTGKVEDIVNHGWLYADKIDSLLTPDINQNKLIIQRWINSGGVFLGNDSNVIGAQEFDNGIWQQSNIYSLGALLIGSYRYTKSSATIGAEKNLGTFTEYMTVLEADKRFSRNSTKYYSPNKFYEIRCCEPVNIIGPIYKAPTMKQATEKDRMPIKFIEGVKLPHLPIDSHKAKHQALLNLYNTLSAALVKLGVEQAAAKAVANNNILKIDAAPRIDRNGKGFQPEVSKVKILATPQATQLPMIHSGQNPDQVANHNRRINQESFDSRPDDYDTSIVEARALENVDNPGRIQSRINIQKGEGTNKSPGLESAWRKHGSVDRSNKSQFTISQKELIDILQDKKTVQASVKLDPLTGSYVREVDVGRVIGKLPAQKEFKPTSTITILTDKFGNLINTYPGTFKH